MNYQIALTPQMLHFVGIALGKMPYAEAAPIIAEIQRQIDEQEQQRAAQNSAT